MKRKWTLQLATFILMMVLFILTVNNCAARTESYKIVGIGCTINEMPMLLPITTAAVFIIDDETDIIGIKISSDVSYMYRLNKVIDTDENSRYKEATFEAIDLESHQYYINFRMYKSGEVQVTIVDTNATAAVVFFLEVNKVVDIVA